MAARKRGNNESYKEYRNSLERLVNIRLFGKWRVKMPPSQRLDRLPGFKVRSRKPGRPRVAVPLTGWEVYAYRMTNYQNSQWLRRHRTPDELMQSAETYSTLPRFLFGSGS